MKKSENNQEKQKDSFFEQKIKAWAKLNYGKYFDQISENETAKKLFYKYEAAEEYNKIETPQAPEPQDIQVIDEKYALQNQGDQDCFSDNNTAGSDQIQSIQITELNAFNQAGKEELKNQTDQSQYPDLGEIQTPISTNNFLKPHQINADQEFDYIIEKLKKSESLRIVLKVQNLGKNKEKDQRFLQSLIQDKTHMSTISYQLQMRAIYIKCPQLKNEDEKIKVLTTYNKFTNLQDFLFKGVCMSQYKIYGNNQIMQIIDWTQFQNKINDPVQKSIMEKSIQSKCQFDLLQDNLRKRLVTQQEFRSLGNLEIFNQKGIIKLSDRVFLMLISEIDENDCKIVFSNYCKMPGGIFPYVHRNSKPQNIAGHLTVEQNCIVNFLDQEKPNLIIIHYGSQQNDFLNQLLPPMNLGAINNKDEFDKGIDFMPSTQNLDFGFNIFNMNYDANNKQDFEEINNFRKHFPLQGLKYLIIGKTQTVDECDHMQNYIINEFDQIKKDVSIIHTSCEFDDDDINIYSDIYKSHQYTNTYFVPPVATALELSSNYYKMEQITKNILNLFDKQLKGPKLTCYNQVLSAFKDQKYMIKDEKDTIKNCSSKFKNAFDQVKTNPGGKSINLHHIIFKSISLRNQIAHFQEFNDSIIHDVNFSFDQTDTMIKYLQISQNCGNQTLKEFNDIQLMRDQYHQNYIIKSYQFVYVCG